MEENIKPTIFNKNTGEYEAVLYVCNKCHEMHADETYMCQACTCESLRIVPETELIN
ncbi:hypothetical protein FITA111629_08735 [Filibacter tadaridae]|uniref:Rubrerythrin-like domain-containing protein n=1 Tax=Filibacter tadaridae TaxID=2483811 RepID=A0A3P5X114_9BACL|nr:hypothetical protein [Filibacter tadaridae]VDC21579.1 hypothetical protein FILTAD_00583 [Filibacter tadaridae]